MLESLFPCCAICALIQTSFQQLKTTGTLEQTTSRPKQFRRPGSSLVDGKRHTLMAELARNAGLIDAR